MVRTGLLQSSTRGVHLLPNPRLKKNLHPTTFLPLCSCFCFLGLTGTGSLCFTGACEEICNLKQSTRAHQATCLRRPAGHRVGLISVLEMPENLMQPVMWRLWSDSRSGQDRGRLQQDGLR